MTAQVKTSTELFWREIFFARQTVLFPSHILCEIQKAEKLTRKSQPWAPPVMASTTTSGLPATVSINGTL
jgi:hypothetical protein